MDYVCYRVFIARCLVGHVVWVDGIGEGRGVSLFSSTVVGSLQVFLDRLYY